MRVVHHDVAERGGRGVDEEDREGGGTGSDNLFNRNSVPKKLRKLSLHILLLKNYHVPYIMSFYEHPG